MVRRRRHVPFPTPEIHVGVLLLLPNQPQCHKAERSIHSQAEIKVLIARFREISFQVAFYVVDCATDEPNSPNPEWQWCASLSIARCRRLWRLPNGGGGSSDATQKSHLPFFLFLCQLRQWISLCLDGRVQRPRSAVALFF